MITIRHLSKLTSSSVRHASSTNKLKLITCYKLPCVRTPVLAASTNASIIKWEVDPDQVSLFVPKAAGAVLPWSLLTWGQKLLYPTTYLYMHSLDFCTLYTPFWAAIVGTTFVLKLITLPLTIKQTRDNIRFMNVEPKRQELQVRLNDAISYGDQREILLQKIRMQKLFAENGVSLKDRLIPAVITLPIFLTCIFHLRNLSDLSLESLKTGGALWFVDLSIPDSSHLLPFITCASMALYMEVVMQKSRTAGPIGRNLMRALPIVMYFFVQSFPSSVLLFWCTNNLFTVFYSLLLRNKKLRQLARIPEQIDHSPADLPMRSMGFRDQLKSMLDKAHKSKTTADLRRLDEIQFRKAGTSPLKKTYKPDK